LNYEEVNLSTESRCKIGIPTSRRDYRRLTNKTITENYRKVKINYQKDYNTVLF